MRMADSIFHEMGRDTGKRGIKDKVLGKGKKSVRLRRAASTSHIGQSNFAVPAFLDSSQLTPGYPPPSTLLHYESAQPSLPTISEAQENMDIDLAGVAQSEIPAQATGSTSIEDSLPPPPLNIPTVSQLPPIYHVVDQGPRSPTIGPPIIPAVRSRPIEWHIKAEQDYRILKLRKLQSWPWTAYDSPAIVAKYQLDSKVCCHSESGMIVK